MEKWRQWKKRKIVWNCTDTLLLKYGDFYDFWRLIYRWLKWLKKASFNERVFFFDLNWLNEAAGKKKRSIPWINEKWQSDEGHINRKRKNYHNFLFLILSVNWSFPSHCNHHLSLIQINFSSNCNNTPHIFKCVDVDVCTILIYIVLNWN